MKTKIYGFWIQAIVIICGRKKLFFKLDETFDAKVKFWNNTMIPINGRGKISIRVKDKSHNFISNVLYICSKFSSKSINYEITFIKIFSLLNYM